jgi:hypothetical protein
MYTERHYRRLRLALVPVRVAACAVALWAGWRALGLLDRPMESTGSVIGDTVFGLLMGVLIGVDVIVCVAVAVLAWMPLPKPE